MQVSRLHGRGMQRPNKSKGNYEVIDDFGVVVTILNFLSHWGRFHWMRKLCKHSSWRKAGDLVILGVYHDNLLKKSTQFMNKY